MMAGTSINTSTESREGLYADVSLIGTLGVTDSDTGSSNGNNGNHFGNDGDNGNSNGNSGGDSSDNLGMDFSGNGIVGVEFGSYSTESYATTTAEFGSDSTAETYSVSSYDI